MTAVNIHMNPALDFLPHHSRSNSASSTHSASHSGSQSTAFNRLPPVAVQEDLYRPSYHHQSAQSTMHGDAIQNHSISNSALKAPLRPSHIRARVAASPYPRDTDSLSSSSETEDISFYLSAQPNSDYPAQIYGAGPSLVPSSQEAMHAAGALGRMSLNQDQALEKLAANVRAATTTSASDRAKQIFVQAWLAANYAPYPDGNVPRQGLYFSYRRICDQYGIPHINTATLGKAIRLCFPTIKTRRLGVRGNSKYHYCGIRPATAAEAEWLQDYIQKSNNSAAQASVNAARHSESANRNEDRSDEDEEDGSEGNNSLPGSNRNSLLLQGDVKSLPFDDISDKTPTAANLLSQAQSVTRPIGTFPPTASIRRFPAQETNLGLSPASSSTVGPSALCLLNRVRQFDSSRTSRRLRMLLQTRRLLMEW
jgi:regulatory factor X